MGTDYKAEFIEQVDVLIAANIESRTERMAAVQALIDRYIEKTGERPDAAQLGRLSDYILREELTDTNPYKSEHNEYPILSEIQLERRREGRRGTEETNMRGETRIADGDETSEHHSPTGVYLATDGNDYRNPIRRTRTKRELIHVDGNAKIRNKERARQYELDTAPGPVVSYYLQDTGGVLADEFVQCVGISRCLA